MSKSQKKKSKNKIYYQTFGVIVGITLFIWILRGLGALGFMPGLVIWILIFMSIGSGAIATFQSSRRW
ncbi:hypothetical protein IQ235_04965 [Oscillatoriales cyanobacterium LEGE 11467]|uniref:Uncharacterized protein n=2 Tax=Zarconia TaxID=2992130 RepID=A0A928VWQ4_9CYAN|nr:hypothetical protein [Zarconia navalis LEGE 11467]